MKTLYESIFDADFEPTVDNTKVQPHSKAELQRIIGEHIKKLKPRPGDEVDLNWIDISGVDDLSALFRSTNYIPVIDKWDITRVKNFSLMFAYNRYIVRSPLPILQENLLFKECYDRMFEGCTSLEVAPELPAMELTKWCYCMMFYGCTSLEVAPELPAKKLAIGCYAGMFVDCSSLVYAPELPAMELKSECYESMFTGCKALEKQAKTPEKASVHHAVYASNMYQDCPKIK